jgi:hypothetical protein
MPLDVTNFKKPPEKKVYALYLVQAETKQPCNVHFPHIYTNNHNRVLIFLSLAGRKHKPVPQLHQTEKTDRNFGFENATTLPKCLAPCVNGNSAVWVSLKSFAKFTLHSCWWLHVHRMHNRPALFFVVIFTKLMASNGRSEK